jgi:glutaredoxin
MSTITVFTHADCHLCEQALAALRALQAEHPFELDECDIRADEALHRAYFERVPVVALDGEELCEYVVDVPLVRERLAAAARAV